MGRTVCAAVSAEPDLVLAGGADPGVSADPGAADSVPGLPFCAPDLDEALAAVEKAAEQTAAAPADGDGRVVVDFTRPDSVASNVLVCLRRGWPAVVGTTGLDADGVRAHRGRIRAHRHTRCWSPPTSPSGLC